MAETVKGQRIPGFNKTVAPQNCFIFVILFLTAFSLVSYFSVKESNIHEPGTQENGNPSLANNGLPDSNSFGQWWAGQYKELYKKKEELEIRKLDPDLTYAIHDVTAYPESGKYLTYIMRCPFIVDDHALPRHLTIRELFGLPSKEFLNVAVQIHARFFMEEILEKYWADLNSTEVDNCGTPDPEDGSKEDASDMDPTGADASTENTEDRNNGENYSDEEDGKDEASGDKDGKEDSNNDDGEGDAPQYVKGNSDEDEYYEEDEETVPLPSFLIMSAKVSAYAARVRCQQMKMRLLSIEDYDVAQSLSLMLEETIGDFWTSGIQHGNSTYNTPVAASPSSERGRHISLSFNT